ncbi:MAG TPA: PEP-CTERM sorting domain-containing protein [Stellaceae bacterium]|nr:PEP-CTERM sorting domain-containing protein [Stellaceae bacterium]
MKAKPCFALLMLLALLCISTRAAEAGIIPGVPPNSNFEFHNQRPATMSYNATTEIFAATAIFGGPALLNPTSSFESLVSDIVGSFSLTATVDHSGNVLGGSFLLTGTSATLGILSPATLLSGNVTTGGALPIAVFQFSGDVVTLAPSVQSLIGPIGSAVLDFTSALVFTHDFTMVTPTTAPDIFLVSIPEPATALLFAAGIGLLSAWRRRGRRITSKRSA